MAIITGTSDPDILDGHDEDDIISGLGGKDVLTAGAGDDTLRGGRGNDSLTAGTGDDLLLGGAGNDYLTHDRSSGPITFTAKGQGGYDFFDVTELGQGSVSGGAAGYDTLRLDWADAAITVTTSVASGGGRSLVIKGIERFEVSTGNFDDYVSTGSTSDAVGVQLGANSVFTHGGDDAVSYTARDMNQIDGGRGLDELQVGADDGVVLNFSVTGKTATDGLGSSLLNFERYDVLGNTGDDNISGGARGDLLRGRRGNDTIDGAGGNDDVRGQLGDDTLRGGIGNDSLRGGKGVDVLDGGDGDDRLYSSRDDDTMTGGAGADRFIFGTPEIGRIAITDFETGVDHVEIRASLLPLLDETGPLDASRLSFGAAAGSQAQLVLVDRPAEGQAWLVWDQNGEDPTGGVLLIAQFDRDVTLAASDILIF